MQLHADALALFQGDAVGAHLRPGERLMGVQEEPGGVFVAQGVPDLPVQGAAKAGVQVKFAGDAGLPGRAQAILHHVIGGSCQAHHAAIRPGKGAGVGQSVAAEHPPGRGGKIAAVAQTGIVAVHQQGRVAAVGAVDHAGEEESGILPDGQSDADHALEGFFCSDGDLCLSRRAGKDAHIRAQVIVCNGGVFRCRTESTGGEEQLSHSEVSFRGGNAVIADRCFHCSVGYLPCHGMILQNTMHILRKRDKKSGRKRASGREDQSRLA